MSTIPQYGAIDNIPMTNKRRKILGKLLVKIIKGGHFYSGKKNEFRNIFHQLECFEFNSKKEELFYMKLISEIAFNLEFPTILLDEKWLEYFYRTKSKLSLCFKLKDGEIVYKTSYNNTWELISTILADLFKNECRRLMEIRRNKGLEVDSHIVWHLFPFWLYRNVKN